MRATAQEAGKTGGEEARPLEAGAEVRAALAAAGDRPLLYDADHGTERTGRELLDHVQALAGALGARGLQGRRIGLWFTNGVAAFEAFLAVELLGATRVPVDPSAASGEAQGIFDAGRVDAVVADAAHAELLAGGSLVHDHDHPLQAGPFVDRVTVAATDPLIVYPRAVAGGELFGVPTSYGNWATIMDVNRALYRGGGYGPGFGDSARYLTVQQLMHGTGMVGSFPFLLMGLPQVVLSRFDPARVLELIDRHRVTATFAVPGMLSRLADLLESAGVGPPASLRHTLYGGAPISAEDLRRVHRFVGPSLCQLYGRFEAGWPLAVLTQADHAALAAGEGGPVGSCGRAVDEVEMTLRAVPGRDEHGPGELCTRSGMVSPAYAERGGWCTLGDTAEIDAQGYIHLTGRLDGMINTGSYHVYPAEVQDVLARQPGVRAVLVRGEPDPVWGQAVTAYVVTDDAAGDELVTQLRRRTREELAPYKVPKRIHVVEELPDTGGSGAPWG